MGGRGPRAWTITCCLPGAAAGSCSEAEERGLQQGTLPRDAGHDAHYLFSSFFLPLTCPSAMCLSGLLSPPPQKPIADGEALAGLEPQLSPSGLSQEGALDLLKKLSGYRMSVQLLQVEWG